MVFNGLYSIMPGETKETKLVEAIRDALTITLEKDPTSSKESKIVPLLFLCYSVASSQYTYSQ